MTVPDTQPRKQGLIQDFEAKNPGILQEAVGSLSACTWVVITA